MIGPIRRDTEPMAKKPKWVLTDRFPAPLLRITGQITIAAGQLDYVLLLAYKRASGKSMKVGMGEAEKIRDVKKLIKVIKKEFEDWTSDAEAHEELSKILEDFWEVYQRRHTVVHGIFVKISDGSLGRFYSDKPKVRVKSIDYGVKVDKLRNLRNDLRSVRNRLMSFTKKWLLGKRKKKNPSPSARD